MQQQARDEAGNIWELDAAGNPVRLVTPAPAPQQGRIFTLPPNPKDVRQEARQAAQDARQEANDRRQAAKDAEDTRRFNLTHNPDGTPKKTPDDKGGVDSAKARADAMTGYASAHSLRRLVADLRSKFKAGPGSTGALTGLADYLPTATNRDFDAAADAARGIVGNALGFTGGQLNSLAEAQMAVGPYIPKAGDYDEVALAKIDRLEKLADDAEARSVSMLGGRPDANGNITPINGQRADNEVPGQANGADTKPPVDMRDEPETVAATGDTRYEPNDRLKSKIDSLISAGSFETANAVLRKEGLPPISPIERQKIVNWQKANPGKAYTASQIGRDVPLTAFQSLAGSPLGAGAARFANSATAGLVGAVAGDKGRGALDAMAAAHPNASLAGDLAGGVLGAVGAEAGIAGALGGRGAAWLAPRLGDASYGALSGFNAAQDGEGLQGAAMGAGAGLVGGLLGSGAARAAGATFRGVQNPAARYLRDRGVPLTVGQTVGDAGFLGRNIKNAEDAMTSIPGVGSMVSARRLEGMEGFNRAAFQDAGAPINAQVGATGADGIQQLRNEVGGAYDNALGGTQIDANSNDYLNDLTDLVTAAERIPNVNGASDAAQAALEARMGGAVDANGFIPGRNFQEAYRGLARTGRERANGDYGHEIGQVMRQGQDALASALEAQNPGAFTAFRAANSANRNANVLAGAVDKAKNTDELFTPAQLNMADAASTRRLSGPMASAAGDRPFYDLTQAGQSVLPSRLPDSGTATRGMVGLGLIGGAGVGATGGALAGDTQTGAGAGLGTALLLAAGGSRPAQRFLTSALLDRPDLAVELGNALARNARVGGRIGAGSLTPLAIGQ